MQESCRTPLANLWSCHVQFVDHLTHSECNTKSCQEDTKHYQFSAPEPAELLPSSSLSYNTLLRHPSLFQLMPPTCFLNFLTPLRGTRSRQSGCASDTKPLWSGMLSLDYATRQCPSLRVIFSSIMCPDSWPTVPHARMPTTNITKRASACF